MYKIAILDKDEAYLERLVSFLQEHHRESFEISAANSLDELDMDVTQCNALFLAMMWWWMPPFSEGYHDRVSHGEK